MAAGSYGISEQTINRAARGNRDMENDYLALRLTAYSLLAFSALLALTLVL